MNDDDQNLNVDEQAPSEESSSVDENPVQDGNEIATDEPRNDSGEEPTLAETADESFDSDAQDASGIKETTEGMEDSTLDAQNDSEEEAVESSEKSQDEAVVEPGSESNSAQVAEEDQQDETVNELPTDDIIHSDDPNVKWYVVHTYSGHENKVATALKQRVEAEHLENKIMDVLVPTQEKIEIRGGKKTPVKEKIFPGYILVKMNLDDNSWLAVRTTQGVTSFIGIGNKPTPIPEAEVRTIVRFMTQGAAPTFKDVFMVDDTVKIIDGPFSEFIGKVDSVDKEHGKVRVLVSIFGRETPVELDFLQVQKL